MQSLIISHHLPYTHTQALQHNTARTTKEDQDRVTSELVSARKGFAVAQDQRDRMENELHGLKEAMREDAATHGEKVTDLEEELQVKTLFVWEGAYPGVLGFGLET